jgi:hypothetical protein
MIRFGLKSTDNRRRGTIMGITLGGEERRKEAMELFIKALQAAPGSFITALCGKSYAKELIDGANAFKDYLFPSKES